MSLNNHRYEIALRIVIGMSNAFRTPVIDSLRTVTANIIPSKPGSIFSIRRCRSLIRSLWRYRTASSVRDLLDLKNVLNPRVAGGGLWFRLWSRRLSCTIDRYLINPHAKVETEGPFLSPLWGKALDSTAVQKLQRTLGALFLSSRKVYFDPNEVRGLWFQKKRLECHMPSNWGKYEIRCDGNGRDFASFIENKASRNKIFQEYFDPFNNSADFNACILAVLRERKRFACNLGFQSWTEMQSVMNGYPVDTVGALEDMFKSSGGGSIRKLAAKMAASESPQKPSLLDEQFLLNTVIRRPLEFKKSDLFEHKQTVSRIVEFVARQFEVSIEEVKSSLTLDGWHKDVRIFSLDNGRGFVYLDLFRRPVSGSPLASAGPHCSVLMPSDEHVRIYMGLQPPYRSEVTFKKERFLTIEEITAIMHELGHAMHIILRPRGSPVSQLPLDIRESVSTMMELLSFSDDFLDYLSNKKLTDQDKRILRRDDWFYLDILRNVAVSEFLHSDKFDPDSSSALAELRPRALEVYQRFSPWGDRTEHFFNPLAGEAANYIIDGESRFGYLIAYARASQAIRNKQTALNFFNETGGRVFDPFASATLKHNRDTPKHPLSPLPNLSHIWGLGRRH